MAKVKRTKKVVNKTLSSLPETDLIESSSVKDISSRLRLGESYISLALGAIVVLGISIIAFFFIKESQLRGGTSTTINETEIPAVTTPTTKAYVLQEGESLWDVAVKFYGDGYRYTEIIQANKLENPDYVPPGTKLIIPNAK